MLKTVEGRSAGKRSRPSECVARLTDASVNSTAPLVVQRLAQRFGVSPEVAALVAQLAGLGPQEARR